MATATLVERVRGFFSDQLWSDEPLEPRILGRVRSLVQLGIVIGEGFVKDQLLLRAHSLTYLTFLSIVPLLALLVTVVNLVGGGQHVVGMILDQFGAAVPPDFRKQLLQQVGHFQFGALGSVGGGALLATTVLAVGAVERSLNAIWGVKEQRPWLRRIPDYLAVLIVAPVLLAVAVSFRASMESEAFVQRVLQFPGIEQLYGTGLQYAPILMFFLAFAFLYWFLPNTRVEGRSALIGGAAAAVLFAITQRFYIEFSIGAAKYNVALGALAGVALFLVVVYVSWAIVLFGAEVAYAVQTIRLYRREVQGAPASTAARETIGLAIALACARSFDRGDTPWTPERLSDGLHVPLRTVREVMGELGTAGILSPCGAEREGAFQLARPLEKVRVADILQALRGARDATIAVPELARTVSRVLSEVDRAASGPAESQNLRDLVEGLDER